MNWILVAGSDHRTEAFAARLRQEDFRISRATAERQALDALAARHHDGAVILSWPQMALQGFATAARRLLDARGFALPPLLTLSDGKLPSPLTGALPVFAHDTDTDDATLLAHLRAVLRRTQGYPRHHRFGALGLDPGRGRASLEGRPLTLRPTEFNLLGLLIEAQGSPLPAVALADRLWPDKPYRRERLAVHLHNLRRRLGGRRAAVRIQRVDDRGYALSIRRTPSVNGILHATAPAL
ncbi:hypothetical protein BJI67_01315 [Acidihalobacter aeolianus]|uniref:OmpR/PhoB-type domain-containing protein n=1 Tax=Acidihalobacter aeolianus TaxID=2792603 RepID=A0A1D8K4L0_9GAMM|nr:winged helix-turn-helix domain-containing protein [Acidihalobacter aeolianus]AOV15890.1 hypothetical protein BJI67_01315 [Acidihalobacter aeolianus]